MSLIVFFGNGLTVDGFARPGGPTETTLNSRLANTAHDRARRHDQTRYEYPNKPKRPAKAAPAIAYDPELTDPFDTPPFFAPKPKVKRAIQKVDLTDRPLRLGGGVGQGQVNRGQDVIGLKNALAWAGHYPVDKAHRQDATPDEDLHWALIGFQRDYGLKTDGFSRPGGETEARLNDLISPLIKRASTTTAQTQTAAPSTGANLQMQSGSGAGGTIGAARNGSMQVADGSEYRPSGLRNSAAWAFEEAGRHVLGAGEQADDRIKQSDKDAGKMLKDGAFGATEGALRFGADAGRAIGLDNAADSLDHFLDGTGTDRVYSRDEARDRPFIREAEKKNQERFVDSFARDKSVTLKDGSKVKYNYKQQLLNVKDGETRQILPEGAKDKSGIADHWEAERSTLGQLLTGNPDEALAFGTNQFRSDINDGFTASREGDTITVTGVVNHNWKDRYDFDGESSPDPIMNRLRDSGRAAEFDSSASWAQKMTVKLKIVDGDLKMRSIDWRNLENEVGP